MSIKDILVHVDHTESSVIRLKVAAGYVSLFGSHLTGLHVQEPLTYEYYQSAVTPEFIKDVQAERDGMIKQTESLFVKNTKAQKDLTNLVFETGNILATLVKYASVNDVVIVGQQDPLQRLGHLPEKLAMASGGPVIVIPDRYEPIPNATNVLIAWNGKKESIRAIRDALPWLIAANSVKILSVNVPRNPEILGHDIGEHLSRHSVNVEVDSIMADEADVATCLLAMANDYKSNMLVMGAYGHSRLQEVILGGVTISILESMDLPVLLSH